MNRNQSSDFGNDKYPMYCGCGDKIMVSDQSKREDFRQHWRGGCPAPPTEVDDV